MQIGGVPSALGDKYSARAPAGGRPISRQQLPKRPGSDNSGMEAAQGEGNQDQDLAPSPTKASNTSQPNSNAVVPNKPNSGPNYVTAGNSEVTVEAPEVIDPGDFKHMALVGKIRYDWERNKLVKQNTDLRLLVCLRMRKGVYSPLELANIARSGANSTIYMNIVSTKCAALASSLKDILLSPGDRPCGLEPRHLPDLPLPMKQMIFEAASKKAKQLMQQASQAGAGTMSHEDFETLTWSINDEMLSTLKTESLAKAKIAAEAMELACWKQMDDGEFDEAFAEFLEYLSTYPTAFLKGPYGKRKKELTWGPGWTPLVESKQRLHWKAVSPFDIYPAPLARNCQDRSFIERMRLSYTELYECIGCEGYDEEALRWALEKHQGGMLRNWIWTDAERARLENDTTFDWFCKDDLIDALHYWGSIEGSILTAWGVKGDLDPQKRYEVDAIQIGQRIVRCVINGDPLGRRPYRSACYEEVPGSIWGRAVPELGGAQQDACNAAARALINNMGIASGPQVGINTDRMPPGEKITQLYPWKIWQFNRDEAGGTGTANAPLSFFQPQSFADELWKIYFQFKNDADDATGIPRYTYGNDKADGAGQTLGGLHTLMAAASLRIKRCIKNIDLKVLAETVYDVFINRMLHDPDPQIKGDCNVVPRGSAALLIKEQMQLGRQAAMQLVLSNPLVQQFVGDKGIADLLREYFKGLHLPSDFIPVGADLDHIIEQIVASRQHNAQTAPHILQAQTAMAIEKDKSATRKAVESSKEANMMNIERLKLGMQPMPALPQTPPPTPYGQQPDEPEPGPSMQDQYASQNNPGAGGVGLSSPPLQ